MGEAVNTQAVLQDTEGRRIITKEELARAELQIEENVCR